MKKLMFSIFALALSATMARADGNSLVVTLDDGTQHAFLLSALPDISMSNDKMTITAGEETAQYDLYKVKTFTFSSTTAVKAIEAGKINVQGDALVIPSEKAEVSVYTVDGSAVKASVSRGNGNTVVGLGSLPAGRIYIINAGGKSLKIKK